jgi:alpha-L-fucosidase
MQSSVEEPAPPRAPVAAGGRARLDSRRRFCALVCGATALAPLRAERRASVVPPHLRSHERLFQSDPHAASVEWFRTARFGIQIHYGLYSLLGRGEWVQYMEKIPLAEYEKLKGQFTARKFDADFITDLAVAAEAKYINFVSRHHDSFALWNTRRSDWNSVQSPARRDFMAEMAEQCHKKALGLFVYYSYALDWWHPYFYPREFLYFARPEYAAPEPRYKWTKDEDFSHYLDYAHGQIRELLTGYGQVAGVSFDPIMGYYARPDLFPIEETYAMIRRLQPHALISFKQGATGAEDIAMPEHKVEGEENRIAQRMEKINPKGAEIARRAWAANRHKHNEVSAILQPEEPYPWWGYDRSHDGHHRGPDYVRKTLATTIANNYNLLLNIGPLPDGSVHPEDVRTLRAVGQQIRREGWPAR